MLVKLEKLQSSWFKVDVDVNFGKSPLASFNELCLWLELRDKAGWTYDQTHQVVGKYRVSFWIKDPKLATLFKLTWA